jgi:hypothetical protein
VAINKPDTASRLELYARAFGRIEAITADDDPRSAEQKLAAVRRTIAWVSEEETRQVDRAVAATSRMFEAMTEQQRRWLGDDF